MNRAFLGLVLGLVLVLTPFAAAANDGLSVNTGATSLDLRPAANYERAVLTVAVPGGAVLRRELDAATPITIDLFELGGSRLPDGAYAWELTLAPRLSNEAKQRLAAARGTGNEAAVQADLVRRGELPAEAMIYSGSFSVNGGTIVAQSNDEARAPKASAGGVNQNRAAGGGQVLATRDQVIPDDLIVQGSGCFGFDCVNNESFGFDTIRLKENNLRIKFEDTSVGTFPTNDWQLTANDSASGGASKFSIEDITGARVPFTITAGAATNSIFADSTGRIGFRTSTPVLDLHVNTSNTPALRLEQNNSGGFTAQTWDIAGNEANFFVRDVTGGSRLSFRIRPGAPTSSLDISSDGDVGVGTASPDTSVDIVRSGDASEVQATTFSSDGAIFPNFIQRRAGGSSGAPTATQNDNIIGSYSFRGHDGAAFSTNNIARLEVRAEQNFTAAAQGTRMIFQTTANGAIAPSTRMVIKNDGSVGIGTASPTAGSRLEVNGGSIRVTGGSFIDDGTTLTVPDYVFEPDYELRPLDELESFISENKHLPGVPSRADVKKDGLNLSEFQMRLLEKVEELTLYTLKQHETLQALTAQNAELAARLAALETSQVKQ